MAIAATPLPPGTLLAAYATRPGGFTDCYVTEVPGTPGLADYVAAFYTSPAFRPERLLLGLVARRPAGDADARRLALAETDSFSAWTVEARSENQLLMRDVTGGTRSWFMVAPGPSPDRTRLHFGSAVVPRPGKARLGPGFRLLLGFHRLYSRALLASARRRLLRH